MAAGLGPFFFYQGKERTNRTEKIKQRKGKGKGLAWEKGLLDAL